MRELEAAIAEIDRARDGVDDGEIRTNLDSIKASLEEMVDTAAGEQADVDDALGDTQFDGAAPRSDHLQELEANLREQEETADHPAVAEHLETARNRIERLRTRRGDEE